MTDLDYLKLNHEAKDAADVADITGDMDKLEFFARQGRWCDANQLIDEILVKYKTEANQYNQGRTPAQTSQERASACYNFLNALRGEKVAKKAAEKLTEEALKHLGGN